MNQDTHHMELENSHESGAETWLCPICGRCFVVKWQPFNLIVLNNGDIYVTHYGHSSGIHLHVSVSQGDDPWTETIHGLDWGEDG